MEGKREKENGGGEWGQGKGNDKEKRKGCFFWICLSLLLASGVWRTLQLVIMWLVSISLTIHALSLGVDLIFTSAID